MAASGAGAGAADVEQWHLRAPVEGNPVVFFGACSGRLELPRARCSGCCFCSRLLAHARRSRRPRRSAVAVVASRPHPEQQHNPETPDISIGGQPAGRLRMELWKDLVPKTGQFLLVVVGSAAPSPPQHTRLTTPPPTSPPPKPKHSSRELPAVLHGRVHARGQAHRVQGVCVESMMLPCRQRSAPSRRPARARLRPSRNPSSPTNTPPTTAISERRLPPRHKGLHGAVGRLYERGRNRLPLHLRQPLSGRELCRAPHRARHPLNGQQRPRRQRVPVLVSFCS